MEQSVKALVSQLAQVETKDISNSIIGLQADLDNPIRLFEAVQKLKGKLFLNTASQTTAWFPGATR